MNNDVKVAEDLAERKIENGEVLAEAGRLKKMLKSGFDSKTDGMERTAKALASNDPVKIGKFYSNIANEIRALALTDNLDKLNDFLMSFGITVEAKKNLNYISKGKKKQKFLDAYNEYFLEEPPRVATEAGTKIVNSMIAIYNEARILDEAMKDEMENLDYACSKRTFSTLTSILTAAKKKDITVDEATAEVEVKISETQDAVDLLGGSDNEE